MEQRIDRNTAEVMRDEMVMKERILSRLTKNPETIPQIAEALEFPSDEIMFWVMAMWRYGALEPVGKPNDDGYYKYRAVE